jgi:DNA repair exonuclease SbcCD ATPase subunit
MARSGKAAPPPDPKAEIAANLPVYRREVPAHRDRAFLTHQTAQEYRNQMGLDLTEIDSLEKLMATHDDTNSQMSRIVAQKIGEFKGKLLDLKGEIQGVRQSIKESDDQYAKMRSDVDAEFNERKEKILAELREVDAQLAHYAEWMRMSDQFKAHLAELKSAIHHNRVMCSEGIAETRQNAQAKIEKHRIHLAEAIRQARAESLRLRPGDISDLSTTFLTQSEAHLQSLNSQIESSEHLSVVNYTIDDENGQLMREIERLSKKNQELKEQEEKQKCVLAKLKAVKREFAERQAADQQLRKAAAAREKEDRKREADVRAKSLHAQKQEFKMNQEQEAFITFLNECATSVRSVMNNLLGRQTVIALNPANERFEAPRLSAMIAEIREGTGQLETVSEAPESRSRHVLTPAAAYFAFSAPFDDGDDFIASETWSFAKYEQPKPGQQQRTPKIVRIKTPQKPSL